MTDVVSAQTRSWIMSRVHGKNTKPELLLRSFIHSQGYRYRLHKTNLPGKPDLAFPSRKKVVFVHGCFWHGHTCPRGSRLPKTNTDYWSTKIKNNVDRYARQKKDLKKMGWKSLVVWECELSNIDKLKKKIISFLQ